MQCPCGGQTKRTNWVTGPAEVCVACGRVQLMPMPDEDAAVHDVYGLTDEGYQVAEAFQALTREQRDEVWRLMREAGA